MALLRTCCVAIAGTAEATDVGQKDIFGRAEHILVGESRLDLLAKLDTGADTSSLHATKIRRYRSKNRKIWIEFRVSDKSSNRTIRFTKVLVRYAYIKEHEGPSQKRPVVRMEICLGDHQREIEVSLVDRGTFEYPVLLGRNALEGHALIDPELEFTTIPGCPKGDDP